MLNSNAGQQDHRAGLRHRRGQVRDRELRVRPFPRGRESLHGKGWCPTSREVRARDAGVLVIVEEGDRAVKAYTEHVFYVPETPTY